MAPPAVPKRGGRRMSYSSERVRVAVRCRPLVPHEAGQETSVAVLDRGRVFRPSVIRVRRS